MTGKEIYKIWAPAHAKWTNWIRPVPFIPINDNFKVNTITDFSIPNINYVSSLPKNSALIVDLPNCDSITEGIALAKFGFRPIPIFNGTIEQERKSCNL